MTPKEIAMYLDGQRKAREAKQKKKLKEENLVERNKANKVKKDSVMGLIGQALRTGRISKLTRKDLDARAKRAIVNMSTQDDTARGRKAFRAVQEEAPTVNAGSGNVAGIGIGPKGEPGVDKKKKRKGVVLSWLRRATLPQKATPISKRKPTGLGEEQLDELSKKTLRRYMKKSLNSMDNLMTRADKHYRDAEFSAKYGDGYNDSLAKKQRAQGAKLYKKSTNREDGFVRARQKLRKKKLGLDEEWKIRKSAKGHAVYKNGEMKKEFTQRDHGANRGATKKAATKFVGYMKKYMEEARKRDWMDAENSDMKQQGGWGNSQPGGTIKKLKSGSYWAKNKSGTMKVFKNEKGAAKHSQSIDEVLDSKMKTKVYAKKWLMSAGKAAWGNDKETLRKRMRGGKLFKKLEKGRGINESSPASRAKYYGRSVSAYNKTKEAISKASGKGEFKGPLKKRLGHEIFKRVKGQLMAQRLGMSEGFDREKFMRITDKTDRYGFTPNNSLKGFHHKGTDYYHHEGDTYKSKDGKKSITLKNGKIPMKEQGVKKSINESSEKKLKSYINKAKARQTVAQVNLDWDERNRFIKQRDLGRIDDWPAKERPYRKEIMKSSDGIKRAKRLLKKKSLNEVSKELARRARDKAMDKSIASHAAGDKKTSNKRLDQWGKFDDYKKSEKNKKWTDRKWAIGTGKGNINELSYEKLKDYLRANNKQTPEIRRKALPRRGPIDLKGILKAGKRDYYWKKAAAKVKAKDREDWKKKREQNKT